MQIIERPIEYYVNRIKNKDYFSFPGYGDSAWICMLKEKVRLGTRSGFGMLHTEETGDALIESLAIEDPNYLRAAPKAIPILFKPEKLQNFFRDNALSDVFYERDMVLDELAEKAGLYPLISELQRHSIVFVGNPAFKKLDIFDFTFISTGTPDFHLDYAGMDRVVEDILKEQIEGIYLFAAGMSSALMISRLHGRVPNSYFIDVGSIFDAFVGIGGQREWRAKLYEDEKLLKDWKQKNVYGE